MNELIEYWDIVLRLVAATMLGAAIGLERNIHGRPAGLRTHLLVSLGAANFVILSIMIPSMNFGVFEDQKYLFDPSRIAAQIVTGIGFLGAGVIIKDGLRVRGLTTAASLWASAGVGMAAGAGFYFIALITTVISLSGLLFFQYLENFYIKDTYYRLTLVLPNEADPIEIRNKIKTPKIHSLNFSFERDLEDGYTKLKFNINIRQKRNGQKTIMEIVKLLEVSVPDIKTIKWTKV